MPLFPRKKPNPGGRPSKYKIQGDLVSGVCLILLMVYFTYLFLGDIRREQLVHYTFRQTVARITNSHLDTDTSKPRRPFYTMVDYSYVIDGKPYASRNSVFEGDGDKGRAKAEARVADWKAGDGLTVYYNPANPADTVLSVPADETKMNYLYLAGFWLYAILMFIRGIAGLRYLGP